MGLTRKQLFITGAVSALVVSAIGVGSAAAQDNDGALTDAIDEVLTDPRLEGAQSSVVVSEADTGEVVYDQGSQVRSLPASVTKTLTSAAAMEVLGADYRFSTDALSEEAPQDGAIAGDLYLRGTGDPTMLAQDYAQLAADLAAEGVSTVEGDLVADDTAYDSQRLGLEWAWDDEPYYYAAGISALTVAADEDYDAGSVIVTVTPGDGGEEPQVTFSSGADYFKVDNRAETVADGETDITVQREHGENTVTVSGQIAAGDDPVEDWASVHEPTGHAATVFTQALADNGITVNGETRLGQGTPSGAQSLAGHESMPLEELMVPFLKLSNNGHAESLVKAMGRQEGDEGSWDAGLETVGGFLSDHGMNVDTLSQADGSGLSRRNNIPAVEINNLLQQVREKDWYSTWYEALPIACQEDRFEGGTLRERMCDTPAVDNVHAKTGSLSAVSGLGGYVTDADGRDLVFTVVFNDLVAESVTDLEDQIAVILASYSAEDPSAVESLEDVPRREDLTPGGMECSWVKPIVC